MLFIKDLFETETVSFHQELVFSLSVSSVSNYTRYTVNSRQVTVCCVYIPVTSNTQTNLPCEPWFGPGS